MSCQRITGGSACPRLTSPRSRHLQPALQERLRGRSVTSKTSRSGIVGPEIRVHRSQHLFTPLGIDVRLMISSSPGMHSRLSSLAACVGRRSESECEIGMTASEDHPDAHKHREQNRDHSGGVSAAVHLREEPEEDHGPDQGCPMPTGARIGIRRVAHPDGNGDAAGCE